MARFTLSKAKDFIRQELGISAAALTAPPEMNQNPKYPYYEMQTGACGMYVRLYTNQSLGVKMLALYVGFDDGPSTIGKYYYADTLTEAPEFAESQYWQDIQERVEECDLTVRTRRLSVEARDACQRHFRTNCPEVPPEPYQPIFYTPVEEDLDWEVN